VCVATSLHYSCPSGLIDVIFHQSARSGASVDACECMLAVCVTSVVAVLFKLPPQARPPDGSTGDRWQEHNTNTEAVIRPADGYR